MILTKCKSLDVDRAEIDLKEMLDSYNKTLVTSQANNPTLARNRYTKETTRSTEAIISWLNHSSLPSFLETMTRQRKGDNANGNQGMNEQERERMIITLVSPHTVNITV